MKKGVWKRFLLIFVTVVFSILFILPSTPIYSKLPPWWGRFLPSKGVTLGLDLQGGMHLVLEVEGERAVDNTLERTLSNLKNTFAEKKMVLTTAKRDGQTLTLAVPTTPPETLKAAEKILDDSTGTMLKKEKAPGEWVLSLKEFDRKKILELSVSQSLETIRNRIDQFGVSEPLIQRQEDNQILIQLPGVKDPERAIELIGKTALLEFKVVDDDSIFSRDLPAEVGVAEEEKFLKDYQGKIPPGTQILFERRVDKETGAVSKQPYLLHAQSVMTGDLLSDARVALDEFGAPYISIAFDGVGAEMFAKVTEEHLRKRLAIVLDNNIYSAPVIQERISEGRAQISGTFTTEEANDLAIALRAGALPAPVKIIQNVTVGPTLGQDSIRQGIKAGLMGTLFVVLFMIFYYRLSGLLADFAMALNVILLIGALAVLNATLTLPGIAGIILTIGMSVDANVLIFERIREELRNGRPVRLAIDAGYGKAFSSILDSHVTTLITAFVLFMFGTGPVKGFAVSLSLGVIINLFTALVGTKVVFDLVSSRRKIEQLSI